MTEQSMTDIPARGGGLELTIAGRFTGLIGAVCLAALLAQSVLGGGSLSPRRAGLAGLVVAALLIVDWRVQRCYGERPPLRVAMVALMAHALLVEALTLLDGLTYTAIMYLTLPFPAFFLLGVRAGAAVSGGLLGWFTLKFVLLKPGGLGDPAVANTYLLFLVALALIAAVALVIQRERAERQRAEAVRMANRGVVQLDPAAAAKVAAALAAPPASAPMRSAPHPAAAKLTDREREVMALVASGANNREIAERLVISEGTVKSHISSILGQLGLRDRTQIAVFVHQQRLYGF